MKKGTLVVIEETSAQVEHGTVFEAFMATLYSMYKKVSTPVLSGGGSLNDMPIDAVIASGLWVIIQKVAQLIGMDLTTQSVVEKVSARVDRLVSAGILLVHGSAEEAAKAFDRDVLRQISGTGFPTSLQQLGMKHSAQFFATLVKAARDYKVSLEESIADIFDANSLPEAPSRPAYYTNITDVMRVWHYFVQVLDERLAVEFTFDVEGEGRFLKIEKQLRSIQLRQNVLSALRYLPKSWPFANFRHGIFVDAQWIGTQIVLAVLRADDDTEILSNSEQLMNGLEALHTLPQSEVVTLTMERLSHRAKRPLNKTQKRHLENFIGEMLYWLLKLSTGSLSAAHTEWVMLSHLTKEWYVDASTALRIAKGEEFLPFGDGNNFSTRARTALSERVAPAILWESLTLMDFYQIVKENVLPVDSIIDGMKRMPQDLREAAVRRLMKSEEITTELVALLVDSGDVELEPKIIQAHFQLFSLELLEKSAVHLLTLLSKKGKNLDVEATSGLLWKIVGRMPPERSRHLVDALEWRATFCETVDYVIYSSNELVTWADIEAVRKSLGDELYSLVLLSSELNVRIGGYGEKASQKDEKPMPPWHLMYEEGATLDLRVFFKALGMTAEQAADLVNTYSEEYVFRWHYAAHPKLEQEWKKFVRLREKYYRR